MSNFKDAAETAIDTIPERSPQVKKTKPNFYNLKGKIDLESLKTKFEEDLFNNLKLAEKSGVFNVLKDMQYDAHEKMGWV